MIICYVKLVYCYICDSLVKLIIEEWSLVEHFIELIILSMIVWEYQHESSSAKYLIQMIRYIHNFHVSIYFSFSRMPSCHHHTRRNYYLDFWLRWYMGTVYSWEVKERICLIWKRWTDLRTQFHYHFHESNNVICSTFVDWKSGGHQIKPRSRHEDKL